MSKYVIYDEAVKAFHIRLEQQQPLAIWSQPSRNLSKLASGNWYFYNVRGYLGRIGLREAMKIIDGSLITE